MIESIVNELVQRLRGDQVSVGPTERIVYSRDLWPLHTLRLRRGVLPPLPGVIVWPENEQDVVAILEVARRRKVPVTPYGGGSGVLGGAMASAGGIIMDLKRMSRLVGIDPLCGTCVVEPGILGAHLEARLNERGWTLGHFPSSLMTATVGGYVATRSAGQFSSRFGKIEDMVVSLRLVAGTGEVLDTEEDSLSAGTPDYNQILLGSEGTLGVVTRATLKIHPVPAASAYEGVSFGTVEAGLSAMRRIMQAGLRPTVLRLYDEIDTYIALQDKGEGKERRARHGPGLLDRFPRAVRGALRVALARPERIQAVLDRILPGEVLLVFGFEGEPEEVAASVPEARTLSQRCGGRLLGPEPGLRWLRKRYDVSYNMPQLFQAGAFVDTIEVAGPWDRIPGLYHAVRREINRHVLVMAHFSHAYPEGVSIYFSIAGSAAGEEAAERRYFDAWNGAMRVVMAHRCTVSHHHGVGRMKAAFVAREQAGFLPFYHTLKARLDPDGILNPGKLYGEAPVASAG